jgi:hypothetical protein
MLSPFVSRLALRLVGLVLLAWAGLRLWFAFTLWTEYPHDDVARLVVLVLGAWGSYDGVCALGLLAVKNWARYFAFLTLALHFALFWFVQRSMPPDAPFDATLMAPMIVTGVMAALVVLASKADEP